MARPLGVRKSGRLRIARRKGRQHRPAASPLPRFRRTESKFATGMTEMTSASCYSDFWTGSSNRPSGRKIRGGTRWAGPAEVDGPEDAKLRRAGPRPPYPAGDLADAYIRQVPQNSAIKTFRGRSESRACGCWYRADSYRALQVRRAGTGASAPRVVPSLGEEPAPSSAADA